MKKVFWVLLAALFSLPSWAVNAPFSNQCSVGNTNAKVSGMSSTNTLVGSYPACTVTVYLHGTTTLATLYSDNLSTPTPLTNPFTANTNGAYRFYTAVGEYDVVMSGGLNGGFPTPYTISDAIISAASTGGGVTPSTMALPIAYYPATGNQVSPALTQSGNTAAPLSFSPSANKVYSPQTVDKFSRVNVLHPDFGIGTTIMNYTLSGNLACTGNPTVTVGAPYYTATGITAVPEILCSSNHTLYVDEPFTEGAGYNPAQPPTITVTGGGTSGAIVTPVFRTPGPADPTGTNCSDSAIESGVSQSIQNAFNADGSVKSFHVFPVVYIPGANLGLYKLCAPIRVPSSVVLEGDDKASTALIHSGNFPFIHRYLPSQIQYGGIPSAANVAQGGIRNLELMGNGHTDTTAMIEGFSLRGSIDNNLYLSNSGGMGISYDGERIKVEDSTIWDVKFPVNHAGVNESDYSNVNIQDSGMTDGEQYFYGWNAVGGKRIALNFGGCTLQSAGTDAFGNGYYACSGATAPTPIGTWMYVQGFTSVTALNGYFQATNALNGCATPALDGTGRYSGSSACATSNANEFVVIANLSTGTPVQGPDYSSVLLTNTTTPTTTQQTASVSGATWQVGVWPQYNPAILWYEGSQEYFHRTSVKTVVNLMMIDSFDLLPATIEGTYCEGAAFGSANPCMGASLSMPYSTLASPLLATQTGCSANSPCYTSASSWVFLPNQVYFTFPSQATRNSIMWIACRGYNPASTAPCADNPAVLQNQIEVVQAVEYQSTGQLAIVARGEAGSTAGSPTWPANSLIFFQPRTTGNLISQNNHVNPIDLPSGYHSLATVGGAFPLFLFGVGGIPDGVTTFSPAVSGAPLTQGSLSISNSTFNPGGTCTAATAYLGNDCAKLMGGGGMITLHGNISFPNGLQVAQNATDLNNCANYGTMSMPVVFDNYGGVMPQGTVRDETSDSWMYHLVAGTSPCTWLSTVMKGAAPIIQFMNSLTLESVGVTATTPNSKFSFFDNGSNSANFTYSTYNGTTYQNAFEVNTNPTTGVGSLQGYAIPSWLINPMTTLGDTLYGGTSGAPTRLSGNTTATPEIYTETGTGSAANGPIWRVPSVLNIPIWGSTPVAGYGVCWLTVSTLGHCTTAVGATGQCTCQ